MPAMSKGSSSIAGPSSRLAIWPRPNAPIGRVLAIAKPGTNDRRLYLARWGSAIFSCSVAICRGRRRYR